MATASIELGSSDFERKLHGKCLRQEALAISSSTATLASAVTVTEKAAGVDIVRVSADTACYVAVGPVPDPTLVAATAKSTARRWVNAGMTVDLLIAVGDFVAVKAAP